MGFLSLSFSDNNVSTKFMGYSRFEAFSTQNKGMKR